MCQLRALLNEMWGEADATKPKLRVVGGKNFVKEPTQESEPQRERQITFRPAWRHQRNGAG
jgi:hypothetical protein